MVSQRLINRTSRYITRDLICVSDMVHKYLRADFTCITINSFTLFQSLQRTSKVQYHVTKFHKLQSCA